MHRFVFRMCGCLATMCSLALVACGDDGAADEPSASGSGGAGASGSAASTGSGDAGGSGEGGAGGDGATGCPEFADRVPMPELGPWMYGPHPGPCSQIDTMLDTGEETSFVYDYDGQRLIRAVETAGSTTFTHTFEYDGGRMVRMIRTSAGDPRVLDIGYDARAITYGNDDYFVRYDRDDQGRFGQVTFDSFLDELPPVTTEIVYDGCRLVRREQGVNPLDGTPNGSLPAFTYVFEGELLVERIGEKLHTTFDYSCW
ncbi:hypothetical protein [Sorangium sp. So ce1000]|uniref:hypothetical protein n=1 Tax=Sorangium sp. So ce1000 TaxID=3133325 RepID=UPI003F5FFB93